MLVPPDPLAPSGPTDIPRERRFVFVQLLFSLAIAEVVRQIADLQPYSIKIVYPAYAHLGLAGIVIATSWMGWSTTVAAQEIKADRVYGGPFVFLILDLVLVALYFILTKGVETMHNGQFVPSADVELRWVAAILWGYTLWDWLTIWFLGKAKGEDWYSSFSVAILATGLFYFLDYVTSAPVVLLVDITLAFLILSYRAAKEALRAKRESRIANELAVKAPCSKEKRDFEEHRDVQVRLSSEMWGTAAELLLAAGVAAWLSRS